MPAFYSTLNGIEIQGTAAQVGNYPATTIPAFLQARDITLVRIPLNALALQPTALGALDATMLGKYTDFADEAYTQGVQVIWTLPTTGLAIHPAGNNIRITLDAMIDFWGRISDSTIGESHPSVLGYALLPNPSMLWTQTNSNDADVLYGTENWSAASNTYTTDMARYSAWLRDIVAKTATYLRDGDYTTDPSTKRLYVPIIVDDKYLLSDVITNNPYGPYVNESDIWYECPVPIMVQGTPGNFSTGQAERVTMSFTDYEAQFSSLAWTSPVESAYRLLPPGTEPFPSPISAADLLPIPSHDPLPEDPITPPTPPTPDPGPVFVLPPEPTVDAFPPGRNFRPKNFKKRRADVPEGQ